MSLNNDVYGIILKNLEQQDDIVNFRVASKNSNKIFNTHLLLTGNVLSLSKDIDDDRLLLITESGMKIINLDLSKCKQITDLGLSYVSELTLLMSLDLSKCWITDLGLSYVSELTLLMSLIYLNVYKLLI